MQLFVLPAAIVFSVLIVVLIFGRLTGQPESIQTELHRLEHAALARDRHLAAYNIATMIPRVTDPAERAAISRSLVHALGPVGEMALESAPPSPDHGTTVVDSHKGYLLIALGQLGQPMAWPILMAYLHAPEPAVRQGAIRGVLAWPDRAAARAAVPELNTRVASDQPAIRAEAAAALGVLALPSDDESRAALRTLLEETDPAQQEGVWNAAVALARLDDPAGYDVVVHVLLQRDSLANLPGHDRPLDAWEHLPHHHAKAVGYALIVLGLGLAGVLIIRATLQLGPASTGPDATPPPPKAPSHARLAMGLGLAGLLTISGGAWVAWHPTDHASDSAGLSVQAQDRIMLATLASVADLRHPAIWERVHDLARHDPSPVVRQAAQTLLDQRVMTPATHPATHH